jgi:integrase
MALSDTVIRTARPRDTAYKLSDGRGLSLLVNPNGSKWWRLRYRFYGREKMLSLGVYPDVPLKLARERCDDARKKIAAGQDPSVERHAEKAAREHTFEIVAREWLALQQKKLSLSTYNKSRWMLETFIFPDLGARPIGEITAPDLLTAIRKIEARGINETARRTKQRCGQVLRYAIATGRAQHDISADLRGALAPVVSKHHAAITDPTQIGELLRAVDGYSGQLVTAAALKLAPLVFVRPGELRAARWTEFDLERAEWRISAERMKMREAHVVPLSTQAVEILKDLVGLTGRGSYVFPSVRTATRPMSENTINAALRRIGYSTEEMTGHGFRALASTCLNELGWAPDVIELQLAHKERNAVRAAYNRSLRLSERKKMMQSWANHLDELRAAKKVVPLKRSA